MAGYVIHLAVAEEYLKKHKERQEEYNEFINGVIFPDSIKDKLTTHYGEKSSVSNLYEFLKVNKIETSFKRGYFLHILTDYLFYNKYVDRMSKDIEYLEEEPYLDCAVDLKARFDEIIGVTLYQDKDLEDIYFAVSNESVDYVRTKWMHSTQIELDDESQSYFREKYPTLKEFTFFSIECRENSELYSKFASYTGSVVLLEPVFMREKLALKIESGFMNYKQL